MSQKRITALGRRLGSFLNGPHIVLFVSYFLFGLFFGLTFVWSIKRISEGDMYLSWVPLIFIYFLWNIIIKKTEYLLMFYYKTVWVLISKFVKPFKVEQLDPNKPHLREGLLVLIQTGYALGVLISFLNFF